jgi:hypothetical protein
MFDHDSDGDESGRRQAEEVLGSNATGWERATRVKKLFVDFCNDDEPSAIVVASASLNFEESRQSVAQISKLPVLSGVDLAESDTSVFASAEADNLLRRESVVRSTVSRTAFFAIPSFEYPTINRMASHRVVLNLSGITWRTLTDTDEPPPLMFIPFAGPPCLALLLVTVTPNPDNASPLRPGLQRTARSTNPAIDFVSALMRQETETRSFGGKRSKRRRPASYAGE